MADLLQWNARGTMKHKTREETERGGEIDRELEKVTPFSQKYRAGCNYDNN